MRLRNPFTTRRADLRGSAAIQPQPQGARVEERASIGETIRSSDAGLVQFFGQAGRPVAPVTVAEALTVPAIWAAVAFLSETMAALPVKIYEKDGDNRRTAADQADIAALLNDAANDELSAFDWRKEGYISFFTEGRFVSFLERDGRGRIVNIWPLEVGRLRVERRAGRLFYHYNDAGRAITYAAADVLDLKMFPAGDGLSVRSPIYSNAATIGLALAVTRYGARYFDNGGVPAFTITGPIRSAGGVARASADLSDAVRRASAEGHNGVAVPEGHTLAPLGIDPEKMQMVEVQRFLIEQVARIYGLPPVFLQDLTHGTFSNTEQQDLHLVKHRIAGLVKGFEQQTNLKLYGRGPRSTYAECNLDALMRGDLASRADGISKMVASGQITPNEGRRLSNRPDLPGGDRLMIQGAMIPLEMAGQIKPPPPAPQPEGTPT